MLEHEVLSDGQHAKKRKRVGRGESSGYGKTAAKGAGGQKKRNGKGKPRRGFEGGQTPMYRRMPKRGFTNIHALPVVMVNVDELNRFDDGQVIDLTTVQSAGIGRGKGERLRICGRGELTKRLTVKAGHFSGSSKQKIEAAGGLIEVC